MTTPVAAGYASNTARTHGDIRQVMENIISFAKEGRGGNAPYAVTESGDAFTPPNDYSSFTVSAETSTTDNLANISPLNLPNGRHIILRAAAGHTITLKHNAVGTGKLSLLQSADKAISGNMAVELRYDSSTSTFFEHDRNFAAVFPSGSAANLFKASPTTGTGEWLDRFIAALDLDANNLLHHILGWKPVVQKNIVGDSITPAANESCTIKLHAETGTADDLKFIDVGAGPTIQDARIFILRALSGDTITLRHAAAGATGNQKQLIMQSAADVILSGNATMMFQLVGTQFIEVKPASIGTGFGYSGVRTLLATPSTPTVTPQGTTGGTTYTYKVVATDAGGTVTAASAAGTTTTGNATLSVSNFNRLSNYAISGGQTVTYKIYRTAGGATQGLIGTTTASTFDDTGLAGDASTAPATATYQGEYWHIGSFTTTVAFTATKFRAQLTGTFQNDHAITVSTEMQGGDAGGQVAGSAAGDGNGFGAGAGGTSTGSNVTAGGGGGFGGAGGAGGTGATGDRGGRGGKNYDILQCLFGSSGGGGTANAASANGAGGAGGGGFQLLAVGAVTINGDITADGAVGGDTSASSTGCGGGGSGGGIDIGSQTSITVNASKSLFARGGRGGNASNTLSAGGGGGSGGYVRLRAPAVTNNGTSTSTWATGGAAGTGSAGQASVAGAAGTVDLQPGITPGIRLF